MIRGDGRPAISMLIAIDIGNTTLQIGVFDDRKIVHTWRLATQHDRLADEYGIFVGSLLRYERIDIERIDGAIVSSVVPALGPGLPGGLPQVPADRAAAGLAAHAQAGADRDRAH